MTTKYKNMRMACGEAIEEIGRKNKKLIHVTSDGSIAEGFGKQYPRRYFDVGIAEQNLIGVAAGLAIKGQTVIINAISSFILLNAYLQIRNDLCFPKLKVIIIGVGSGLSYGQHGYTHHSLEDIAVMNTLPNMNIYIPADANESVLAIKDAVRRNNPAYIRIGSGSEPTIYKTTQLKKIKFDKPICIAQGKDVIIFSAGRCVYEAFQAVEILKKKGIQTAVININALNCYPFDCLFKVIKQHCLLLSVEEHYVETGIGSLLANLFFGKVNIPFIRLGAKKEFCGFAGTREELLRYYQIDKNAIVRVILDFYDKK